MSNRHKATHNSTLTHRANTATQKKTKTVDDALDPAGQRNPHHQMSTNQNVNTDYLHPSLGEGWGKELPHDFWENNKSNAIAQLRENG